MKIFVKTIFAIACTLSFMASAHAQPIETRKVQFQSGTSGAVISDDITGSEIIDFVLGVSGGQRMVVDMSTTNASAYYNITGPGASGAVHIGSTSGLHFDGILPSGGDWTIRVYLMRNAARRNETANFELSVHVGGASAPAQAAAEANAGGPDFWEVQVSNSLRIRSGPSGDAAVVGRALNGQIYRNMGCQGSGDDRWCNVSSPNGLVSGWVAGRFLVESGVPAPAAESNVGYEADAMGPDFWQVTGVASDDYLNVRNGPNSTHTVVARAANGTTLRNIGCQGVGDSRWCHVQTIEGNIDGWVSGAYLREGAAPAATGPAVVIPSGSDIAPTLYVRPTGETEAQWSSGCTVLYNPSGARIAAGPTCSEAQLIASDSWVALRQ